MGFPKGRRRTAEPPKRRIAMVLDQDLRDDIARAAAQFGISDATMAALATAKGLPMVIQNLSKQAALRDETKHGGGT